MWRIKINYLFQIIWEIIVTLSDGRSVTYVFTCAVIRAFCRNVSRYQVLFFAITSPCCNLLHLVVEGIKPLNHQGPSVICRWSVPDAAKQTAQSLLFTISCERMQKLFLCFVTQSQQLCSAAVWKATVSRKHGLLKPSSCWLMAFGSWGLTDGDIKEKIIIIYCSIKHCVCYWELSGYVLCFFHSFSSFIHTIKKKGKSNLNQ